MSRLLISLLRHHPDMPPYAGEYLNLFRKFLQHGRLGRHSKRGHSKPWLEGPGPIFLEQELTPT